MNTHRALVCLSVAAFAWPATVGAQSLPTPAGSQPSADVLGAGSYSCVDPSDALARRKLQAEPCKWPLIHLPATAGSGSSEPRRLPNFPPKSTGPQADHPMFWRFPVQPGGPFGAPRHSWH